jgi:hypothetical protein
MNKRKRTGYFALFILILAGFAIGNSACDVEDPRDDLKKSEGSITAKNVDRNTSKKYDKEYSNGDHDGFVSYHAKHEDGSSVDITLDDPENDGVMGEDLDITDMDQIIFIGSDGKQEYINNGTFTIKSSGGGVIKGTSSSTGDTWEIMIEPPQE